MKDIKKIVNVLDKMNNDKLNNIERMRYFNCLYDNNNFILLDDLTKEEEFNKETKQITSFIWSVDKMYVFINNIKNNELRKQLFMRLILQSPNIHKYKYFNDEIILEIHVRMFYDFFYKLDHKTKDNYIIYIEYFNEYCNEYSNLIL